MKKLFRFLLCLFMCEAGIDPVTLGLAVAGGGAVLGGLFGKNKKEEEIYDPYAAQRASFMPYLQEKVGTSTPYSYNSAFTTDQPDVEAATERNILGGLNSTPNVPNYLENKDLSSYLSAALGGSKYNDILGGYSPAKDKLTSMLDTKPQTFSDISSQAYEARKARLQDSMEAEMDDVKNMYNRLGLVSSTPGLQAQADVREKQRLYEDEISADIAEEEAARNLEAENIANNIILNAGSQLLGREATEAQTKLSGLGLQQGAAGQALSREGVQSGYGLDATGLLNTIVQNYINQGQILGGAQRGYQQTAMGMSQDDINRMTDEELAYAQLMAGILGGNPPQRTVTYTPNTWAQLGNAAQNIGTSLMTSGLLGGKK